MWKIIFIYFLLYKYIILKYCRVFCYSDIFKSNNILDNFQQLLDNVFLPLFETTVDPNSHPDLHR